MSRRVVFATLLTAAIGGPGLGSEPLKFDGFGLGDFAGTGSIAADLERIAVEQQRERLGRMPELAVIAPGPVGRDAAQVPLTAELRSHVERFDVAAGLLADTQVIAEGPARWLGRIGVSNVRPDGRESLELRTMVGNNAEWGLVGVEVGPRLERRLRKGVTVFIDGKAEAQARRSTETGWWSLPGTATDGAAMVGVGARTGLTR